MIYEVYLFDMDPDHDFKVRVLKTAFPIGKVLTEETRMNEIAKLTAEALPAAIETLNKLLTAYDS